MFRVLFIVLSALATSEAWSSTNAPAFRRAHPRMNFFQDMQRGLTKLTAGDYDEEAVRAQIKRDIQRKPCLMYSTTTCPFCKQAKKVLDDMNAMYTNIELDVVEDGAAIRTELAGVIDRTSVPAVFIGGEFVGGANDGGLGGVLTLHGRDELAPLLVKAGSLSQTQRI